MSRRKCGCVDKWVQNDRRDEDLLVCLGPPLLNAVKNGCTSRDIGGVRSLEVLIIDSKRPKREQYLVQPTERCLCNIRGSCERFEVCLEAVSEI